MNSEEVCYQRLAQLLATNKLRETFILIEKLLEFDGINTDLTEYFVSASSQYHRTEKAHKLSLITWEQYNLDNSRIISMTLELSRNLCASCVDRERRKSNTSISLKDLILGAVMPPDRSRILRSRKSFQNLLEEVQSFLDEQN